MFDVKINMRFDVPRALAKIKAASDDALTILGDQALQDISQYVPKDQHKLENSGLTNSDMVAENGEYVLRWSTPYAQYLWNGDVMHGNPASRTYGPEKLKFTDALAREEWAKYAQTVYGEEWRRVYEAALKRGIRES